MLRGRRGLPVLAQISGPVQERAWALRRADFTSLGQALPRLQERQVVLVAGEGEAPAVAAIALAAAATAASRRTILIDCDLARPRVAPHLGLAAAPGLHEYLRWEAEPADVLQPVVLAGPAAAEAADSLVCVCAGRPATKAETLLCLQSFSHMLGKLRGAYDLVLIVAPPLVSEPAACLAVARQVDAVVAGLAADGDKRSLAATIRRLPVPALGAIEVSVG
jgi:polysaccharide biosynthesis transport protein